MFWGWHALARLHAAIIRLLTRKPTEELDLNADNFESDSQLFEASIFSSIFSLAKSSRFFP